MVISIYGLSKKSNVGNFFIWKPTDNDFSKLVETDLVLKQLAIDWPSYHMSDLGYFFWSDPGELAEGKVQFELLWPVDAVSPATYKTLNKEVITLKDVSIDSQNFHFEESTLWSYCGDDNDFGIRELCRFDIDHSKTEWTPVCKKNEDLLPGMKGSCAMGGGYLACKTLLDDTCTESHCKYGMFKLYKINDDISLTEVLSGNNLTGKSTDEVFANFGTSSYGRTTLFRSQLMKVGNGVAFNNMLKDSSKDFYYALSEDGAFTNVLSLLCVFVISMFALML
eukprot:TRINITY_DN13940_c0_g1_i1.p1 TRINITY_DN13940_c0_g1~~TRINITY_DN13940_c0_g1_i1.p1  ORF type:complete len:280 (+),score=65.33 TRINITY_DN13940_c0_g1_i1:530-1369(+)